MSQLNDIKHKVLTQEGFVTDGENINDLEMSWLKSRIIAPTKGRDQVNDLWMMYLWELGFAQASIGERKLAYFESEGGTGEHYNDIELSYWQLRSTQP